MIRPTMSHAVNKDGLHELMSNYATYLEQQLVKANERVKELEANYQLLVNKITPLLDMQEDGEYYARCHLAEEIYDDFVDSSPELTLNKFAIENQIKALDSLKDGITWSSDIGACVVTSEYIAEKMNQLRKEQE
jgi:hypothetical protein